MLQRRCGRRGPQVNRRQVCGKFRLPCFPEQFFAGDFLAALIVKQFAENASIEEMADVHAATHGTDQPLLAGLRHILAAAVGVR